MRRPWLLAIGLILLAAGVANGSSFTLVGFGLSVDVNDGGFPNVVDNSFNTNTNPALLNSPFVNQHLVILPSSPSSTASASYSFVWNENTGGGFHVAGSQTAAEPMSPILFSRSSGQINFAASGGADLFLDMHATFSFVLPPNDFRADLQYSLADLDTGEFLFGGTQFRDSFLSNTPVIGTLSVDGTLQVAAGRRLTLSYRTRLASLGGNVGAVATGSGTIDLGVSVVPEPAAVWSITVAGWWMFGRRRKRRRKRLAVIPMERTP